MDVWPNLHGQWWYAHPVTGAHMGPWDNEAQAREMLAEARAEQESEVLA